MNNLESNINKLTVFQDKYREYYLRLLPKNIRHFESLKQWPIFKFDLVSLYKNISNYDSFTTYELNQISDKLIDIYIIYCYLMTTTFLFYLGPTLIVGSGKIQKLNPNTISLLRENHYKVYLISVLTENLLDFLHLIFLHKIGDYKKNKWGKIIDIVQKETNEDIITVEDKDLLIGFRDHYRTGEFHKFSPVRGFTSKHKWNHFQEETKVLSKFISNIRIYFGRLINSM